MEELQKFLAAKDFPGEMLFAKVWGSRSHNTDKEDSDWDFSGVYIAPTKSILGMIQPPDTIQNKEGQEKPDYSFHEVGKFCNLLLTGNPGILEMLYTDRMCIASNEWEELKNNRDKFLSKKAVQQYVGYSEGQLKRLKAGACLHTKGCGYNEKWAYHLIRLLIDAGRIVSGISPVVWKKDGLEREYLMRIRSGEVSQEEIEEDSGVRIAGVRDILENSCTLPDMGDKEFLNDWLVKLRLNDESVQEWVGSNW